LTGGNAVGIFKDFSTADFTADGANAVRFKYRATGVVNTLEFKFTDSDSTNTAVCDKLDYKMLVDPDGAWREVLVPISSFKIFDDGNDSFGTTAVARAAVAVTKDNGNPGSGTVLLDDIALVRRSSVTSVIDDFETGTLTNSRGAADSLSVDTGATGSAVHVTSQVVTGARGMEFTYNIGTGGFVALNLAFGGLVAPQGTETLVFWIKGTAGGEPVKVEVWYDNGTANSVRSVSSYATVTTSFQKVSIPLADFAGVNRHSITRVAFSVTTGAGSGTVYLDDVAIAGTAASDAVVRVLEDFSQDKSLTAYSTAVDPDAELTFDFVADQTAPDAPDANYAGRIAYEFETTTTTPYALVEKELRPNLFAEPVLRFRFKGTGANNNLEVKLVDSDNTFYVRTFKNITDTGGLWKTASIPVAEFSLNANGDDSKLSLQRIKEIQFALVAGENQSGTFALDELESVAPPDFEKSPAEGVITRVSTPDNPFSPNGDGLKDAARVEYTLGQAARVTLQVFDLRGVPVRRYEAGEQTAGDHAFEWDGRGEDGGVARNGLYLFRLEADGANGRDEYKNVIAVSR
jgi:hypothetical protein